MRIYTGAMKRKCSIKPNLASIKKLLSGLPTAAHPLKTLIPCMELWEGMTTTIESNAFKRPCIYGSRFSTPPSSPDCPRLLKVVAEVHSGWKETSLQDGGQASGEDIENKTESNVKPRMKDTLLKGRNVALKNADDIYSALDIDDAKL